MGYNTGDHRGTTKNVLDSGFVRLVDYMGSDLSIVRSARVSYDADWRAGDSEKSDARLIKYLWKHNHSTPFESVAITLEVKAPIFVFRQWHRHRTMSYNEVSARYTELDMGYYSPDASLIGTQSANNKQMRDVTELSEDEKETRRKQINMYNAHCADAFGMYNDLITMGWPRELARMVLPLSAYSRMFVTVNLLNMLKFLRLRDHEHAQHEIRVYAKAINEILSLILPVTMETVNGDGT